MLLALATSVGHWKCEQSSRHDQVVAHCGAKVVSCDWSRCKTLSDDPDHFTWNGYVAFVAEVCGVLSAVCPRPARVLIVSDSTIDYHNYDCGGEYTGAAHETMAVHLSKVGVHASVDAICGSGYSAMENTANHFCARLFRRLAMRERYDCVLLIGGWNDPEVDERIIRCTCRLATSLTNRAITS